MLQGCLAFSRSWITPARTVVLIGWAKDSSSGFSTTASSVTVESAKKNGTWEAAHCADGSAQALLCSRVHSNPTAMAGLDQYSKKENVLPQKLKCFLLYGGRYITINFSFRGNIPAHTQTQDQDFFFSFWNVTSLNPLNFIFYLWACVPLARPPRMAAISCFPLPNTMKSLI